MAASIRLTFENGRNPVACMERLVMVIETKESMKRIHLFLTFVGIWVVWNPGFAEQHSDSKEPAGRVHLVLLATADLHGNLLPKDYHANSERSVGLAKLATMIHDIRAAHPQSQVMLLDAGDTIQGTPLAYYHARKHNAPEDPMMRVMNHLKYDAMTVGNHEFNFGLQVLRKAEQEAEFPWLSANIYEVGSDATAFAPYLVKNLSGVRVGVIGITTPGMPAWEEPANIEGLRFENPVEQAQKWVHHLRHVEQVDAVVILAHMGLEQDLRTGAATNDVVPMENAALRLARQVEGVDVILMAHTHRAVEALDVNGVRLVQPGRHGDHLARVDLYFDVTDGKATRIALNSRLLPVTEQVPADPEVVAIATPYDAATEAWLDQPIGYSEKALYATRARFEDSAILDLVHRVQLEVGNADLSFAASFTESAHIPAGPVTVRDIAGLYIYENTLMILEMTGQQVLDALEHSAKYFKQAKGSEDIESLVDKTMPGYNFDTVEGLSYQIDLRRPVGLRIQNATYEGEALRPEQRFRVAVNHYRRNGGGGYAMFRDAPVLHRSSDSIRNLIIEWVSERKHIPTEASQNWELLY